MGQWYADSKFLLRVEIMRGQFAIRTCCSVATAIMLLSKWLLLHRWVQNSDHSRSWEMSSSSQCRIRFDISYHSIQHAMNSYRLIKPVIRDDMNSYAWYVCPQTRSSVPVVHCAPYNVGRVGYIRSSEVQISYQYWFSNFRCDSCNVLNVSFFCVTRR